jgi:hypothetical protein
MSDAAADVSGFFACFFGPQAINLYYVGFSIVYSA